MAQRASLSAAARSGHASEYRALKAKIFTGGGKYRSAEITIVKSASSILPPMRKTLLLVSLLSIGPLVLADNIPAAEASSHTGENATVCGTVTGVHFAAGSKGKPTFINFDRPYPHQDFTVMIWDEDRVRFGDLTKYDGHRACATGVISQYKGKPEMILHSPEALQAK